MKKLLAVLALALTLVLPFAAYAADESDYVSTPNISVTTSKGTASFTLKSDTSGARIYYTTNGSDPTTSSTRYSSKVTLKTSAEVRAIAYDSTTKTQSAVGYYTVTVTKERVATPTLTSKAVAGGKQITIKTSTSGATIYYTLDGTLPDTSSRRYSSPFTVEESCTVYAVAVKSGYANSAVKGGDIEIPTIAAPRITEKDGKVTITSSTSGATIYYTTNGAVPTTRSSKYSKPFAVTKACTVMAIAVKNGYGAGGVAELDIAAPSAAEPTLASSTAIIGGYNLKFKTATSGATMYYTLDGTTPDSGDSKYTTSGIDITEAGTIHVRVVAVKSGYSDSKVCAKSISVPQTPAPKRIGLNKSGKIVAEAAKSGDTLFYTTDGTTPTIKSKKLTSSGVSLKAGTVIRVVAARKGYALSEVKGGTVPAPSVADITATHTTIYGGYNVKLSTSTSGATIYYTLDGSTPTTSDKKYTSSGINITEAGTTELNAIAVKSGCDDSDIFSKPYSLSQTAKPTVSLTNGKVTISGVSGAYYYYTTNGTTPTVNSKKYSSPFSVSSGTKVYAVAARKGYALSEVSGGTVKATASAPTKSGETNIVGGKNVKLKCATSGATIYYTLDGTVPTEADNEYTSAGINVTTVGTTRIRAIAVKEGYSNSPVSDSITVSVTRVPNPTITAEVYNTGKRITMRNSLSGVTIYYTLDGTTPTTSDKHYSSAITVNETVEVRAIAVKNGYANSAVVGGTVTVTTPKVETPTLSQKSYSDYDRITLKCATSGAKIYYTIDGRDPLDYGKSISSGSYITVREDCELRAVARKSGYEDSDELRRDIIVGNDIEPLEYASALSSEPVTVLNTVFGY